MANQLTPEQVKYERAGLAKESAGELLQIPLFEASVEEALA